MSATVEPSVPLPEAVSSIGSFVDCPTGTVEHYFADDTYVWSDELYRIYGYERGDVVPTLELSLAHISPADRDSARTFWARISTTGGPSSVYTSLIDRNGHTHRLLISADLILDGTEPIGVWALVVDLTRSIHADTHQLANEAVAASAANRAVIEQAKGILMGRAGVNAAEAFAQISLYSQHTNRKVVVISQEIIDQASKLTHTTGEQVRADALEELFNTRT